MITMRGLSRFIVDTLNTNPDFISLSQSIMAGSTFNYYVNVDLANIEVQIPYFAVVTFDDKDDKSTRKFFRSQLLIGIDRSQPVTSGGVTEEPTQLNLETLSRKAIDLIEKDMRVFGVEGDNNIRPTYVGMYVPVPDGEEDLQMQIDIEFDQDKYLSC